MDSKRGAATVTSPRAGSTLTDVAVASTAALEAPTGCPCGHHLDAHDRVAARYCRATATAGLDRGCVCLLPPGLAQSLR